MVAIANICHFFLGVGAGNKVFFQMERTHLSPNPEKLLSFAKDKEECLP